jgi:bla regulator protein blaR1
MNNFLLESSVCLASFYGFYWLFLRNQKLLSINRIYLLLSTLISVIIPFLSIQVSLPFMKAKEQIAFGETDLSGQTILLEQGTSDPMAILAIVYIAGLIISIALLVNKLMGVNKKISHWPSLKSGQIEVIEIEGMEAFSFFNSVFIGKELNANQSLKDQIIRHELAHIDGKHSLDILLFELLKCIFWFNPISYLYAKSIRLQHEYIADQEVVNYANAKSYERSLLQFTLSKIDNSLLSGFNEHPIQKRLKMIQQLNSNIMNKLKPLLALPILGTLLIAYACTEQVEPALEAPLSEIEIETPIELSLNLSADSLHLYEGYFIKFSSGDAQKIHYQKGMIIESSGLIRDQRNSNLFEFKASKFVEEQDLLKDKPFAANATFELMQEKEIPTADLEKLDGGKFILKSGEKKIGANELIELKEIPIKKH